MFATNEALSSLGVNARNLSQSDKVLARLIITLQTGSNAFGTMNREINTLQSQIRILQGSFANFKLAIGDLVQKPVQQALVWVNGLIIAVTNIIRAFHPLQKEDSTPAISNLGEEADEANEALEELNGNLASFDKFNVLNDSKGAGTDLSITEALTEELRKQQELYQAQLDAMGDIDNKAKQIAEKIQQWFIGTNENGEPTLTKNAETLKNVLIGLATAIALIPFANLIKNIITTVSLLGTVGLSISLTSVGVMGMVAGIGLLVTGILQLIDGNIGSGLYFIAGAIAAIGIAISLITGNWIVAAIAGIVAAVIALGTIIYTNWESISNFLINLWDTIANAFIIAWDGVKTFFMKLINSIANGFIGFVNNCISAINWLLKPISEISKFFGGQEIKIGTWQAEVNWGGVGGFADGGYTNANLIMTHENGKREWVGKAAGSSAIVNDTQMSDIMEVAVAKGVYKALSARSDGNGSSMNEQPIVIKIGEEAVFNVVRKTAKRQGLGFATV